MKCLALILAAALVGCAPAENRSAQVGGETASETVSEPPTLPEVEGEWRVLSINGKALPEKLANGKVPKLTLGADRVGGFLGCNSFGSLALYADGRFATHNWSGTAMYCDGIIQQEEALSRLFFEHPVVTRGGNELVVRSDNHEAVLAYIGPASASSFDPAPQAIAGSRWRISLVDGSEASSDPEDRFLAFSVDGWRGLASCATLSGSYRRKGNRLVVGEEIVTTFQNCPPEYAARDDAFAALMASDPRYLIGPNGELIMAGGGHCLTGGRAE